MVFHPDPVPPVDHPSVDPTDVFPADTPFDLKQATLSTKRHRWFDFRPLTGMSGGSGGGRAAQNIPAGDAMRVQFDHKPDYIQVSISGQTAATGRCALYSGDEGGPYILLGPHGKATIPAPQGGIVFIRNVGTTATYGIVTAIGGYVDPGIDITCGD